MYKDGCSAIVVIVRTLGNRVQHLTVGPTARVLLAAILFLTIHRLFENITFEVMLIDNTEFHPVVLE